ncbi:MAG: hypothetical protein PHP31_09455 [Lentimicrobiaceae bacterium]|nr:hypothetical protein [Lentimicrobiaceae bacterium]
MKTLKTILLTAILTLGLQFYVSAQNPGAPPRPPQNADNPGSGQSGPVKGGGAPIGSGIVVLLTLAGAYGGYKLYKNSKKDEENVE